MIAPNPSGAMWRWTFRTGTRISVIQIERGKIGHARATASRSSSVYGIKSQFLASEPSSITRASWYFYVSIKSLGRRHQRRPTSPAFSIEREIPQTWPASGIVVAVNLRGARERCGTASRVDPPGLLSCRTISACNQHFLTSFYTTVSLVSVR